MSENLRAVVRGDVQGVGFRYFVEREARRLGLSGWVRNRPDGTVECEAEGERVQLDLLRQALQRGPVAARVDAVDATWSKARGLHREFTVRA